MKKNIYTVLALLFLCFITANVYADNGGGMITFPPGEDPNDFDFSIVSYSEYTNLCGSKVLDGGISVTSTSYDCGNGSNVPIYSFDWKMKTFNGPTQRVNFKVGVSSTGCDGVSWSGAINGWTCVPAGHPWADADGDGVPNYQETPVRDKSKVDVENAPDTQYGSDECPEVEDDGSNRNKPKTNVGNPINIVNGNKIQTVKDISFNSPFEGGFTFRRFYNHRSSSINSIGTSWTHNYNLILYQTTSPFIALSIQSQAGETLEPKETVRVEDATGRAFYFEDYGDDKGYRGRINEQSRLTKEGELYIWHRLNGSKYSFENTRGPGTLWRLREISDSKGNTQHLTYDSSERLLTVLDGASGRSLSFHYTDSGKISHISGPVTAAVPDGIWARYTYDDTTSQKLASVTYADNSGYRYEPALGGALGRITDLQGHFISGWEYELKDFKAVKSITADGRGVSVDYEESGRKVIVTDVYGKKKTYTIETPEKGNPIITSIEGSSDCSSCGDDVSLISYDSLQRVVEKVYANGRIDTFDYYEDDNRNNPKNEIIAQGTESERTITYTWHPLFNKELSRTETSLSGEGYRVTIWDYDNDYNTVPNENPTGSVSRIIEWGFTHDITGTRIPYEYITTYRYNDKGQVMEVNGPLTGDSDQITFTYNSTSGDLLSATLPEIGTVNYTHDAAGNVLTSTDANGKIISFTYDGKNRITGTVKEGISTGISYSLTGKVKSVTDQEGRTVSYTYEDQFDRLDQVADPLGNTIRYGYDAYGNIFETSLHSPDGARHKLSRQSYDGGDHPGKLWKIINPDDSETVLSYDDSGNSTSVLDAENNRTDYRYDILNRVIEVIQPEEISTAYGYDVQGNLASVTDPNGNKTVYEFDDQGRNITRVSPETGTTRYEYDAARNLVKERRNDGSITTYSYDDLGRIIGKTYADNTENITYTWDQGTGGKGLLTFVAGPGYSHAYAYDSEGRATSVTTTIEGTSFTTGYQWDNSGILTGMTYPDGRTVTFTQNGAGQYLSAALIENGHEKTLASNLRHLDLGKAVNLYF